MSSAFGGVGSRSVRASAVMLDSGIVVLHGDTGEGVWNHLAPRNRGSPWASPRTVPRSWSPMERMGTDRLSETLILDADTGTAKGGQAPGRPGAVGSVAGERKGTGSPVRWCGGGVSPSLRHRGRRRRAEESAGTRTRWSPIDEGGSARLPKSRISPRSNLPHGRVAHRVVEGPPLRESRNTRLRTSDFRRQAPTPSWSERHMCLWGGDYGEHVR